MKEKVFSNRGKTYKMPKIGELVSQTPVCYCNCTESVWITGGYTTVWPENFEGEDSLSNLLVKQDEDAPDLTETAIKGIIEARFDAWSLSTMKKTGCTNPDCECDFEGVQFVEDETSKTSVVMTVRWGVPVYVEGHLHFWRYSIKIDVDISKHTRTVSCKPKAGTEFELPVWMGPF
ncbi:hypothetical protein FVB32_05445 [Flagellimonas hymeniacidonis]|uniref:Uncharacterized protein n=1 Tax=Flagellimonas hymeniacidonis TaxID=2603628 RepID=A0A5C8V6K2_9FLAO|nr:hypothetical protein [Flagellimonas hymeniacidonis]TXN37734.1 hypothetical protein FVB32_05445 [Flagellimonas hymeniacidonis]